MRISEHIYLVGSGKHGFQLSHSLDCNVYLLDCGGEYALIDAGSGMEPEQIIRNAKEDGIDFKKVTHLLLTHAHGDHAAGSHYFQSRHGLKVVASKESTPWIESGDMEKSSLNLSKQLGNYPKDLQLEPVLVSQSVKDGDYLKMGNVMLKVVETPGHSNGHVAYLWETDAGTILFAGDAIFAGGRIFIQPTWDCSIYHYAQSMAKLNLLKIDRLFAGHGPFLMNDAWTHIEQAHQCFQRAEIPLNF